jgi:hypothetical protein
MKEFTMNKEIKNTGNTVSVGEEKRWKYILNGETFYYTKDELREYIRDLYEKNNFPLDEDDLDFSVDSEIERLEKYDGDPYGHLKDVPEVYEITHKAAAMGVISFIH